jgi:hypothetical protein
MKCWQLFLKSYGSSHLQAHCCGAVVTSGPEGNSTDWPDLGSQFCQIARALRYQYFSTGSLFLNIAQTFPFATRLR